MANSKEIADVFPESTIIPHPDRDALGYVRPALEQAALSVLDEAKATIDDRMESYGSPKPSFVRTAALWSAYFGHPITPRQVCMAMILLKVSRDSFAPKHDNLVDIPGYARVAQLASE